ncbi:MAG: LPS export ABC transporter periplasmic protein LptC [Desulfobacterales bacterium RIFOXYA12_FULL_46_15]|nr:MAG: LPS export ABC transporter periplasmic protein LptC [Desulfobacterales bacterium RIFOXYA12_FULL_46_15]
MKPLVKKKITILLTGLLIVIFLAVSGFLIIDKLLSGKIKVNDIKIDSTAALKINLLKQVSKKNGITEWELSAKSASLLKDQDKAILEAVSVVFFTKEKKIELTSDTGTLNTKTHDMTFSDNIEIKYVTALLQTDKLQYSKKEHIISSDARVRLEKNGSFIEADSMIIYLNDNRIIFEGRVHGSFNKNFNIQFQ